jgi:hypothetical protein
VPDVPDVDQLEVPDFFSDSDWQSAFEQLERTYNVIPLPESIVDEFWSRFCP